MPSPTWTIAIDLNGDGDFTDANEDITSYVMPGSSWQLGFTEPYQAIARAATCTLILNNADKRFSPENSGGALYPDFDVGKKIKISANYSSTDYVLFNGRVDDIQPAPNTKGERKTTLISSGFLQEAQGAEVFIPVMENVTGDEVIAEILSNTTLYPAGLPADVWTLGVSALGTDSKLAAISGYLSAEVGKSTFTVIGDEWTDGISVYGALRDVAGREAGRVFVDRDGIINFWNRHYLIEKTSVDATLAETAFSNMGYVYGQRIINDVIVQARPRLIGSSVEQLAQIDKAVKIGAGKTKSINFRYRDQDSNAKISGKSLVQPVKTADYTATENEDGTGTDYTESVTAAIIDEKANRCKVEFANTAPVGVWLQPGAKIQGIKITDFGIVDAENDDETSIFVYQRQPFTYEFVMDDVDVAEGMSNYWLSIWKDPTGRITSVTLPAYRDATTLTQALTRTIGDRITLSETQTGNSADYFIIGEIWSLGGKNAFVTWMLEPADNQAFWILNTSALNNSTVLAF